MSNEWLNLKSLKRLTNTRKRSRSPYCYMLSLFITVFIGLYTYTENVALLSVLFQMLCNLITCILTVKGIQLSTPSNRKTLLSMARRSLDEGNL